jgi:hypothetical protein
MVVVAFSALLAASILDFELFMQNSGYFCPLRDAPLLIYFLKCLVLLNGTYLTAAVQAFL